MQLGIPQQTEADLIVLAGAHAQLRPDGRTVVIAAPRWHLPDGPDHLLADAYRQALVLANTGKARSMAAPRSSRADPGRSREVTRIALTVLQGTPTTVREVVVVAGTPAMLERWAEAIARAA